MEQRLFSTMTWRFMENKVILCHITAVENVEDIKANGLKKDLVD